MYFRKIALLEYKGATLEGKQANYHPLAIIHVRNGEIQTNKVALEEGRELDSE